MLIIVSIFFLDVDCCNHGEDFSSDLVALILFNCVRLEQLPIHVIELDQEVFIERKSDLAQANFIEHHERYKILFIVISMIDHVHIDDVVLDDNVIAQRRLIKRVLVLIRLGSAPQ